MRNFLLISLILIGITSAFADDQEVVYSQMIQTFDQIESVQFDDCSVTYYKDKMISLSDGEISNSITLEIPNRDLNHKAINYSTYSDLEGRHEIYKYTFYNYTPTELIVEVLNGHLGQLQIDQYVPHFPFPVESVQCYTSEK
ncbi:MAG: hypothetical protein A2504_01030 [Bdellovibrionales bacterium RIFOXYD12_FULL_39_22]|nr:MAG: hypothetical protein A2385_03650 [Bdellovibrionales bacterium RIFOXYB1_FULL_39_21]OFZ42578.1 MAG: hypothetical protein A2485_09655 [Bdellovibrionales bacterium RIFOXYC12_FULL_39_17]OFZ47154.1 MAG: hypothetical protein A2404_15640 [Bdellovibrionales bacterium RIFOXYC1_FULL_39_130]OFZ75402.1 MAG: hypothetical protein A2560_14415 [Bdellovibrionales bacterium RIFOXYD1_FULL_39_84]OFZ93353.1 MAG: hypothetical protein A2504_01030 [Bdellovibrionales bacterium RIFOXYD12_FULL_39_22]HLE09971.1 hy